MCSQFEMWDISVVYIWNLWYIYSTGSHELPCLPLFCDREGIINGADWYLNPQNEKNCCAIKLLKINCKLRYESSTLILYKELSSTIFQSCEWGIGNTCPNLHFLQYIKAWMSSTGPVSSITNCYRLIVSYTDPVHSFIIS